MATDKQNKYQARCAWCGKPVLPGKGILLGKDGAGKWRVDHLACVKARARFMAAKAGLPAPVKEQLDLFG